MPNVQFKNSDLLKAVARLGPGQFDDFLDRALSLRERSNGRTLSAKESRLIQRINRGIPSLTRTVRTPGIVDVLGRLRTQGWLGGSQAEAGVGGNRDSNACAGTAVT